ncbi:phosphatidylglycerophosphatase [Wolbachia endosymbiont of Howardula sp.]|uniref:phosphatidylglycerophosphatase n=1 Tax=Wolbachia endosymbiont of Howardula sp. TaxID=2916816 RepID=UPI00217CC52F|nr:phosphatidylglycerophosphatase [Wolbachia endosymbiont of Howardula sp.]UWI83049.1 phosphatidylglycerophosphatase [Wolbachia endosymbiont of Howardula sp.]
MKVLRVFLGKILSNLFPAKTVSYCFGVGNLLYGGRFWCSIFILLIVDSELLIRYGITNLLYSIPDISIVIATHYAVVTCMILIFQLVGICILHTQLPHANPEGGIVIHIASSQALTIACATPAIVSICSTINQLYQIIYQQIFHFQSWWLFNNNYISLLMFSTIPCIFFNIILIYKPWPINIIQRYNNAISITCEGICYAIYAIILLYLAAFICCDLTFLNVISLNTRIIYSLNEIFRYIYHIIYIYYQ